MLKVDTWVLKWQSSYQPSAAAEVLRKGNSTWIFRSASPAADDDCDAVRCRKAALVCGAIAATGKTWPKGSVNLLYMHGVRVVIQGTQKLFSHVARWQR